MHYRHTPPSIPLHKLDRHVTLTANMDLITVAQALQWFDLFSFYSVARHALHCPSGVLATWCYMIPRVDDHSNAMLDQFYEVLRPYWASERRTVDEHYVGLDFTFDHVQGEEHTEPFEFTMAREMDLEAILTYV